MVMAQRLDIGSLALEGITSAIAGGAQEIAYRQGGNESLGFLTTALTLGSGIALKMFGGRGMAQFADPIFLSGASVAGWQLSRQLLATPMGPLARRATALPYPGRRQMARSGVPYPGRRQVAQPAAALPAPALAGAHRGLSQVSIAGMNSETGEQILFSRV